MADATVALAASNMKLVSSLIISRLLLIVDKTSLRPTPTLDKHKHWDEIAVLARFLNYKCWVHDYSNSKFQTL